MSTRRVLPAALVGPALVAALFFALPLAGLVLRAPWGEVLEQAGSPEVLDALRLSLVSSLAAAGLSLAFGLPLAAWLAGEQSRLRDVVRVLVTLPMVLPPVVGGVALLLAFGRRGLVGQPLDDLTGVSLPFTLAAVVVAQTYIAMPFLVLTVESGLRSFDTRYAEAAATLGATPWHGFRTVVLPMVGPSLRAGLLVAWARALGEFGATITFAGSLAGRTRTMPLAVFSALETRPEAAIVLSLVLVLVSAGILLLMRRRWFPVR